MQGTSRAGWTAIHIAAEKAGIERPVCGDGIEIEYREIPGAGAHWMVSFIGTMPGQPLRFRRLSEISLSVKTERFSVPAAEVEARMQIHPEPPALHLREARRMAKAFGPQ